MTTNADRRAPRFLALAIVVALLCALAGCKRNDAEAKAAADIWHAAHAIEVGVAPALPLRAIKASAEAIAQSNGHQIDGMPEGAAVLPQIKQETQP